MRQHDSTTHCDGDGTVPANSGAVCDAWAAQQRQPVSVLNVPKVNHFDLMAESKVVWSDIYAHANQ